jgi:hypothetical protein
MADVVRRNGMRKYLVTLVFGGCAVMTSHLAAASPEKEVATEASPAVVIEHATVRVPVSGLRDEAAMILVGSALIGLAAAVRRAA